MTDFLNRLAERTLGLTPRVMPRLASRYSHSPLIEPIEDTLTEEPPRVVESHSDRAPASNSLPNDHRISSRTDAKAAALEIDRTMTMDQPSIILDETIVPNSLEPSLLRREPTTRIKNELPTSVALDLQPTMLQRSGNQQSLPSETKECFERSNPGRIRLDGRESTIVRSLPASAISESMELTNHSVQNHAVQNHSEQNHSVQYYEQSRDVARSPALDAQLPPVREGRGNVVRPVMERAAQQFQTDRAEPRALADSGQPFPPPNEPEPSVIRVTIGRIEVRAIMQPAPAAERPKTARTSPVLSLDAYLKQRSGRAP